MQLSPVLQAKVKTIAHRYGSGWDGQDLSQDCFVLLCELSEDTDVGYALRSCHNLCINKLKSEKVRVSCGLSTVDCRLYGEVVDVDKYIEHIHNLRLKAIVDQYVDNMALTGANSKYLQRHHLELDRNMRKYLKQKSAWQILVEKIEPFRRSFCKLLEESARRELIRAQ